MSDDMAPQLHWEDDTHLKIGDVGFYLTWDTAELQNGSSTKDLFILGKAKSMVEQSVAIGRNQNIKKIFEMGILQGGSVALYDQIFKPEKITAIEYTAKPVNALAEYIAAHGRSEAVKPYYGVNQGDRPVMENILATEFPGRDVDLIVDDASHLYDETREAFNVSFPYLRSGGTYLIEDWAWAHWSGDYWQDNNAYFGSRRALSNLLIELFMLTASRPDLISSVTFDSTVITVKRGYGALPPGKFDMGDHYLLRGKTFGAWL